MCQDPVLSGGPAVNCKGGCSPPPSPALQHSPKHNATWGVFAGSNLASLLPEIGYVDNQKC
jgi:hypothetical protein